MREFTAEKIAELKKRFKDVKLFKVQMDDGHCFIIRDITYSILRNSLRISIGHGTQEASQTEAELSIFKSLWVEGTIPQETVLKDENTAYYKEIVAKCSELIKIPETETIEKDGKYLVQIEGEEKPYTLRAPNRSDLQKAERLNPRKAFFATQENLLELIFDGTKEELKALETSKPLVYFALCSVMGELGEKKSSTLEEL